MDRLRRILAQHARAGQLFGEGDVPMETEPLAVNIGRRGIFGNPFRPAPTRQTMGDTMEPYRKWLFAAISGDADARAQYREATGVELPKDFAGRVRDIADLPFWCPGCRDRTEEPGVCHGSILRKAAKWLKEKK